MSKKFTDLYDELFLKPVYAKKSFPKKTWLYVLTLIGLISGSYLIGTPVDKSESKLEQKNKETISAHKDVYFLENTDIKQVTENEINSSNPLQIEWNNRSFITNRGYQFDLSDNVEIKTNRKTSWSTKPDLKYSFEDQFIFTGQLYGKENTRNSISLRTYGNVLNGFRTIIDEKQGSFFEVYKDNDEEDVQSGYVLLRVTQNIIDSDLESIYVTIYKYYIFEDGIGMVFDIGTNYELG